MNTDEPSKNFSEFTFKIPAGIRVDQHLSENLKEYSRSTIQKLIQSGHLTVNGCVIEKSSYKAKTESELKLMIPHKQKTTLSGSDVRVPVIFENNDFAVVQKPPGMTTHPGAGTNDDTLVHALTSQIDSLSDGSTPERPGILHRLDRATEGLLLIAKNNSAHYLFADLFQKKEIIKKYRAFVWGMLPKENWKQATGYVDRHPRDRKKMVFSEESTSKTAKSAHHQYRVLRSGEIFSETEIQLFTGRTHQIRVFFKSIQHPVVGDEMYSNPEKQKNIYKEKLQGRRFPLDLSVTYLRAYHLAFTSPMDKKFYEFSLPMDDWDSIEVI